MGLGATLALQNVSPLITASAPAPTPAPPANTSGLTAWLSTPLTSSTTVTRGTAAAGAAALAVLGFVLKHH